MPREKPEQAEHILPKLREVEVEWVGVRRSPRL